MKVIGEVVLDAPTDKVFGLVSDPERGPFFIPVLAENSNIYPSDGCVGQSWDSVFSLDGVPLSAIGWCTIYEPNERYGIRTKGAIASDWLYTIAPAGSGSRLQVEIQSEPAPAAGAETALLAVAIRDHAQQWIENLKRLL